MNLQTKLNKFHYTKGMAVAWGLGLNYQDRGRLVRDEFQADLEAAYWPANPVAHDPVMRDRLFDIVWDIADSFMPDDDSFSVAADTYEKMVALFKPK